MYVVALECWHGDEEPVMWEVVIKLIGASALGTITLDLVSIWDEVAAV